MSYGQTGDALQRALVSRRRGYEIYRDQIQGGDRRPFGVGRHGRRITVLTGAAGVLAVVAGVGLALLPTVFRRLLTVV